MTDEHRERKAEFLADTAVAMEKELTPQAANVTLQALEANGEEVVVVGTEELVQKLTQDCPVCEGDISGGGIDEPSADCPNPECVGGRVPRHTDLISRLLHRTPLGHDHTESFGDAEAKKIMGALAEGSAEEGFSDADLRLVIEDLRRAHVAGAVVDALLNGELLVSVHEGEPRYRFRGPAAS